MRLLLSILFLGIAGNLFSQKKEKNIIPDDAARKVNRAKKLFNQFKVFDGEKVMQELIKEHPGDCYYTNALLQLQRQVLRYIPAAKTELEALGGEHLKNNKDSLTSDNEDEEEEISVDTLAKKETEKDTDTEKEEISFGLDRGSSSQKKKTDDRNTETEHTQAEAIVTIDSTLLKPEVNEDGDTIRKMTKKEKALQRNIRALNDLAIIPYDSYKEDFIRNARKATLELDCLDSASSYLREFMVDTLSSDSGITEDALERWDEAIDLFRNKNYPTAAKYLERLILDFPGYYSAKMKLADAYFLMNKDTSALRLLKQVIKDHPNRPEPFEKIAANLYNIGLYDDAIGSLIDAIMVYPQQNYFHQIQQVMEKKGKVFNAQWIRREVYPLSTAHVYEEIIAQEKTPWWHYQAAKQDVHSYFDTLGLVRPNEKTNEPYLDVYGWKRMLNNSGKEKFPFARAMDKIGYLDCYVLISLFHQDVHGQFADLVKKHPEKVKKYFYLLINWENKKFDDLRNQFFPKKKEETKK